MKTEDEEVALIASGYEWTCPHCETFNRINATSETVTCKKCGKVFEVGETYHADGGDGMPLIQTKVTPPLIVVVSGGCVTGIYSADGKEYPCSAVVDYDNDGHCPVCDEEYFPFDNADFACRCGYKASKDNAIECAVKLIFETTK